MSLAYDRQTPGTLDLESGFAHFRIFCEQFPFFLCSLFTKKSLTFSFLFSLLSPFPSPSLFLSSLLFLLIPCFAQHKSTFSNYHHGMFLIYRSWRLLIYRSWRQQVSHCRRFYNHEEESSWDIRDTSSSKFCVCRCRIQKELNTPLFSFYLAPFSYFKLFRKT
jgi:hypothetical protein